MKIRKRMPRDLQNNAIIPVDILDFQVKNNQLADSKANFLMVVSGLVLTFSIGIIASPNFMLFSLILKTGLITFTVGMVASALLAIHVVSPRRAIKSKEKVKDIFFYGRLKNYTRKAYLEELRKVVGDQKEALENYANVIYSTGTVVDNKMRYIRYSAQILKISIIFGVLLIITGVII